MKGVIVLGVVLGIVGLGEHALAQTVRSPNAIAAQMRAEPKPAAEGLVKLLESKGILSDTEAALVSEPALQPQTKQLLAELLLSKHLINEKEYDQTIQACSSTDARATLIAAPDSGKGAAREAAGSMFQQDGEGMPGRFAAFSDWISSILPTGGGTTDLDFGTIQPAPLWPESAQERAQHVRAKGGHKSHKHHRQDASQTASGAEGGAPKR